MEPIFWYYHRPTLGPAHHQWSTSNFSLKLYTNFIHSIHYINSAPSFSKNAVGNEHSLTGLRMGAGPSMGQ